jgi:hypothetical protein
MAAISSSRPINWVGCLITNEPFSGELIHYSLCASNLRRNAIWTASSSIIIIVQRGDVKEAARLGSGKEDARNLSIYAWLAAG